MVVAPFFTLYSQEGSSSCISNAYAVSASPTSLRIGSSTSVSYTHLQKKEIRSRYGVTDDDMLVCFCGRLGKEKSVDVMLDFWAQTVKPQDNIKLLIIGEGPSKEELEQQAAELGIGDQVHFAGKILHDKLPPYYAACDLYITTSLSDTNSISMLEGMAAGLPVLHIRDVLNKGCLLYTSRCV